MEQNFHDVYQTLMYYDNLDSFASHFDQHFKPKPRPQLCH